MASRLCERPSLPSRPRTRNHQIAGLEPTPNPTHALGARVASRLRGARFLPLLFSGGLLGRGLLDDGLRLRLLPLLLLLGDALSDLLALSGGRRGGRGRLLLFAELLPHLFDGLLHDLDVLPRRGALGQKCKTLLHLILQLLAEDRRGLVGEAIYTRGQRALVGQVPGDAALVLLLRAADERGVENEAVLRSIPFGLQRPEERLFSAKDLHRGSWVLRQVGQAAGVRDEAGADDLADQRAKVRRNEVHLRLQIFVQTLAHSCQFDNFVREVVDVLHVHVNDVLAHRHLHGLGDLLGHLLGAARLGQGVHLSVEIVAHADNAGNLGVCDVVGHDLGQLWKMPRIPLPYSHRECVDILIQIVKQRDAIDNRLVLPVRV
mmetsp:Transcript_60769/g.185572  ORF Transcript_60769/g.185572 Transcript_60769/m.185572 type:complete len:376 (+) Transcript_60769:298-1425(+)